MTIRSWVIKSWPEVQWKPPEDRSQWPLFHHMGTEVRPSLDEMGRKIGDTVWVARVQGTKLIGVAWEWVELLPGVAAIRDPNGFISNLRLLEEGDEVIDELQSIVRLNVIAHDTPWQAVVAECLRGGHPRVASLADPSLVLGLPASTLMRSASAPVRLSRRATQRAASVGVA